MSMSPEINSKLLSEQTGPTRSGGIVLLEKLDSMEVSLQDLHQHLESFVPDDLPKGEQLRSTLKNCAEHLVNDEGGGALIVVAPNSLTQCDASLPRDEKLQISRTDGGALLKLFRQQRLNGKVGQDGFREILSAFSKHPSVNHQCNPQADEHDYHEMWKDKWNEGELECLGQSLNLGCDLIQSYIKELAGQPANGALVSSYAGTLVAAACLLKHESNRWHLFGCGSRHAAAVGTAEFFLANKCIGAVFVRSNDGGVHVILPYHCQDTLQAFFVPRMTRVNVLEKASTAVNIARYITRSSMESKHETSTAARGNHDIESQEGDHQAYPKGVKFSQEFSSHKYLSFMLLSGVMTMFALKFIRTLNRS